MKRLTTAIVVSIALAWAGVGVAILIPIFTAHADAAQDVYINELHANGIGLENDNARLVKNGNLMCLLLTSQDIIAVANASAPQTGMSVGDTALQIGAAIRWLCPSQTWQINELRGGADPRVPGVSSAITGYLD